MTPQSGKRLCQDGVACKKPGECEARRRCAVFGTPLSDTPRTDEAELSLLDIQNGHGPSPYVPAELARQLERELYAALVCAGVASLERGEWAAEREELIEAAALECDNEAQTQGIYANEAGSPGLRLVHSTASNALMAVAHRIRALKAR